MSEQSDVNTRRIDLWGAVLQLWAHKWVWLAVFAVVTALGATYALTRPTNTIATQWVHLTLADTESEADALQQTALLSPLALTYVEFASTPPYTDRFVEQHPELSTPEAVRGAVRVQLRNVTLMEFIATGEDAEQQATLARDLAASFVETLNETEDDHLVMRGTLHGDPMLAASSSNRSMLLGGSVFGAAALATAVVAVLAIRRRDGQPAS
ncbi:YveK family protein [Tessaracoccus defluvii]|uniref:Polysaccharide chain length determinant N-terminal domain-containing protein n=1 Tax=Tessaracoccus defluvii TaxID=1285901 RepID=A0A7H0H3L1_9ACTN|nr:hypothetical protein [Tessaracoccus defluvii]QNP55127.1 hypothetical protein H9L22_12805 [Tessaracoccus defluvii]